MSKKVTTALIMKVKNEEELLPRALGNIHHLFDEVIVVDTGSKDDTKKIAESFGATVYDFKWIDDFSAPLNYGLEQAKSDYIMFLDADEYFDDVNRDKLKRLLDSIDDTNSAFFIRRNSLQNPLSSSAEILRLFPKYPGLKWVYRCHERIVDNVIANHPKRVKTDIVSFMDRSETESQVFEKKKKWIGLTQKDLQDYPDDTYLLFNLASDHFYIREYPKCIEYCDRCIEQMNIKDPFLIYVYNYLAMSLFFTGTVNDAWACINNALVIYPKNLELLHFISTIHRFNHEYRRAEEVLMQIIDVSATTKPEGTTIDPGAARLMALHRLAELYSMQHKDKEAEEAWLSLLEENPAYIPALRGLCFMYKQLNDAESLEKIRNHIISLPEGENLLQAIEGH